MTIGEGLYAEVTATSETVAFDPTRRAGLARLEQYAPRTGVHYATHRNYDLGPSQRSTTSALSPWIRHRLITEPEVLTHTLARHSPTTAMKFIQEVFWRGYFKGWLEQHPSVWQSYQLGLRTAWDKLESNIHRKNDVLAAMDGRTGIACFDHWCRELVKTGYLHNHARMWFASIWIFTLRLPWELGAQFFLRHLIDGDPASNTLSWRWVGGLHTKGKTYLARPSNIAKYTKGAFEPIGQLANTAEPLSEAGDHPLVPFIPENPTAQKNFLLLVTEEDCRSRTLISGTASGVLGLVTPREKDQGALAHGFRQGAVADAVAGLYEQGHVATTHDWSTAIIAAAQMAGTTQVLTPFAPVGPVATKLEGVKNALAAEGMTLRQPHRHYDAATWPHATKGYFKLKKAIPTILSELGLAGAPSNEP
ncbi:FAD-binding domain-containing protein [Gymnodinialimonas sp. 57CJ19]|uniref:FAD-binding domain-containing protein n=1 Tax=Gymnodinialimonas sp. 57CJ19 TaxID=3138498 RepID=UPI00313459CF